MQMARQNTRAGTDFAYGASQEIRPATENAYGAEVEDSQAFDIGDDWPGSSRAEEAASCKVSNLTKHPGGVVPWTASARHTQAGGKRPRESFSQPLPTTSPKRIRDTSRGERTLNDPELHQQSASQFSYPVSALPAQELRAQFQRHIQKLPQSSELWTAFGDVLDPFFELVASEKQTPLEQREAVATVMALILKFKLNTFQCLMDFIGSVEMKVLLQPPSVTRFLQALTASNLLYGEGNAPEKILHHGTTLNSEQAVVEANDVREAEGGGNDLTPLSKAVIPTEPTTSQACDGDNDLVPAEGNDAPANVGIDDTNRIESECRNKCAMEDSEGREKVVGKDAMELDNNSSCRIDGLGHQVAEESSITTGKNNEQTDIAVSAIDAVGLVEASSSTAVAASGGDSDEHLRPESEKNALEAQTPAIQHVETPIAKDVNILSSNENIDSAASQVIASGAVGALQNLEGDVRPDLACEACNSATQSRNQNVPELERHQSEDSAQLSYKLQELHNQPIAGSSSVLENQQDVNAVPNTSAQCSAVFQKTATAEAERSSPAPHRIHSPLQPASPKAVGPAIPGAFGVDTPPPAGNAQDAQTPTTTRNRTADVSRSGDLTRRGTSSARGTSPVHGMGHLSQRQDSISASTCELEINATKKAGLIQDNLAKLKIWRRRLGDQVQRLKDQETKVHEADNDVNQAKKCEQQAVAELLEAEEALRAAEARVNRISAEAKRVRGEEVVLKAVADAQRADLDMTKSEVQRSKKELEAILKCLEEQ